MKILYLCADVGVPVLGRKGAAVHVRQMIEAMRRAGHQVILAARTLQKSPWEEPARVDVPIVHVRPSQDSTQAISAVRSFNSRLRSENPLCGDLRRLLFNQDLEEDLRRRFEGNPPDLIYERASLFGVAGAALAQKFNRPLILELNAPLAVEQGAYRETLLPQLAEEAERWLYRSAAAVLVVSQPLREHVLRLAESATVRVAPNGVDPARFFPAAPDPALRQQLKLEEAKVIGFVGGLRPWHGVEILPDLFEALAPNHPTLKLLIVGDGPLRPALQLGFEQKHLADRVVFAGAELHEAIPNLIRQFDVALAPYPALNHAFYFSPLKIFEYLACGIATVASDAGQIRDLIQPGKTGLVCPPGDLNSLVEACNTLLGDCELRRRLGKSGAAMVQAHYTWDHNVQVLEETVRSINASNLTSKP